MAQGLDIPGIVEGDLRAHNPEEVRHEEIEVLTEQCEKSLSFVLNVHEPSPLFLPSSARPRDLR